MKLFHVFLLFFVSIFSFGQTTDSIPPEFLEYFKKANELQEKIHFKTGEISLNDKIELNVPAGYKFIPKKESEEIIFDFWGNPQSDGVLGMLVLDGFSLLNVNDWAFVLSAEDEGYVKDEDASDIDYDKLLKEMQESEGEINEERVKNGYDAIHTVGWASKPYYDSKEKILHWAKELQFGEAGNENTLNYDVRILGRNGLLSMNAVGNMSVLDSVKKHIPEIIHIANFKKGHTYFDFDPDVDQVAAYTIGGLVAGKLLAKAGLLALLLKNIKLLILGAIGLFSLFKNKILALFGRGSSETLAEEEDAASEPDDSTIEEA